MIHSITSNSSFFFFFWTACTKCSYACWATSAKHCSDEGELLVSSASFSLHFLLISWIAVASEQINNRSIQDMHIFRDPSHIPIVMVEHVTNVPLRTANGNSYYSTDLKCQGLFIGPSFEAVEKPTGASSQPSGHVLKIVVFVHGFQVCSTY